MTQDPKTVLIHPSGNIQAGDEEVCAKLIVIQGHAPGLQIPLNRPQTTIGRLSDNDLVLDSDTVSRRHGRVTTDDTVYSIEDLNSQNGIAVNGKQLKPGECRTLCHGDRLKFGDQQLVFLSPCGFGDQPGLSAISFDRDQVTAEVDTLFARLPQIAKKNAGR